MAIKLRWNLMKYTNCPTCGSKNIESENKVLTSSDIFKAVVVSNSIGAAKSSMDFFPVKIVSGLAGALIGAAEGVIRAGLQSGDQGCLGNCKECGVYWITFD